MNDSPDERFYRKSFRTMPLVRPILSGKDFDHYTRKEQAQALPPLRDQDDSKAEFIEAVLRKVLPAECMLIGPSDLRDIAKRGGKLSQLNLQGGARLDTDETFALIASAASTIDDAFTAIHNSGVASLEQSEMEQLFATLLTHFGR